MKRAQSNLVVFLGLCLQQLMRERQQMASRPFASVAVELEAAGDEEELQQVRTELQTSARTHKTTTTTTKISLKIITSTRSSKFCRSFAFCLLLFVLLE